MKDCPRFIYTHIRVLNMRNSCEIKPESDVDVCYLIRGGTEAQTKAYSIQASYTKTKT